MRLARIELGEQIWLARVEGEAAVLLQRESDHPNADVLVEGLTTGVDFGADGRTVDLGEAQLRSPLRRPTKYLGVGLNFGDHAAESGMEVPETPTLFAKTPNVLIGEGEAIRLGAAEQIDAEVELVIVIGSRIGPRDPGDPERAILGFTVGNDVTSRKEQFADVQWSRAKSFDTYGPLGPNIVTADEIDVRGLGMRSWIGDSLVQSGSTADMIFSPGELVGYIARQITLEPGDLITTGTPAGVGMSHRPPLWLEPGVTVTVEIEGVGTLRNPVIAG